MLLLDYYTSRRECFVDSVRDVCSDVTLYSVAVVGLKGCSDQITHTDTGRLQPLLFSYKVLENMRQLLPPSAALFQLPVLWASRK